MLKHGDNGLSRSTEADMVAIISLVRRLAPLDACKAAVMGLVWSPPCTQAAGLRFSTGHYR